MYAVIEAGGTQHLVRQGDRIRLNKHEAVAGATVTFEKVLLVADGQGGYRIGAPTVAGASVTATVKAQGKGQKLRIVKFRHRKNYRRSTGHRQPYTDLLITGISG